jgi:hypothetical protein
MSDKPLSLDDLTKMIRGELFEQEKTASEEITQLPQTTAAADLESLLAKSAGVHTDLNITEETSQMNKLAQEQGKAIANALIDNIIKQANAVAQDSTQMVAEQMSQQTATPREGMDITNTLKGLILTGIRNGAATNELSEMVGPGEEMVQGAVAGVTPSNMPAQPNGTAMGSVGENEEQEKVAAVAYLVSGGVDFDSAVSMVKQAEEALAAEQIEMAKLAAAQDLVNAGFSANDAIALVEGSAAGLGL